MKLRKFFFASSFVVAMNLVQSAHAAEGFQVRYNVAGSIGGEMFAEPSGSGFFGGVAYTDISASGVNGDDGQPLKVRIPGGTVPLPAPIPASLYPTYRANSGQVYASGSQKQINLALGYATDADYGGGRIVLGVSLPYAKKEQTTQGFASTPPLNFNPALPPSVRQSVSSQFNTQYQSQITQMAAAQDGSVTQFGDMDLQAGWLYVEGKVRLLAGASLILPTGGYSTDPGPSVGFGNFYTFRPSIQGAYLFTPDIALAGKLTLGLNTRNRDNDVRSGNWVGLEAALGYKTPIGAIGLHTVYVNQYQNDENNPYGNSRFRSMNVGAFFTTKIPTIDAALTLQYMTNTSARNAKDTDYLQVRIIKLF